MKLFGIDKIFLYEKAKIKYIIRFFGIKFSFKTKWNYSEKDRQAFNMVYQYSEPAMLRKMSKEEYKEKLNRLYANLDDEATKHLDALFKRIYNILNLAKNNTPLDNSKIYAKEDLKEFDKLKEFHLEIKDMGDYFQYKNYKLPEKLFSPSVFLHKHGMDTLKTFDKIGDKVILDVGTCIGDSILVFRDYTKNQIIGFEPVTDVYEKAMKTMELNNIDNYKIEKFALGDKEEETKINITPDKSDWGTMLNRQTDEFETIRCRTLDNYVRENNLKVGLIKVDVEGFEPNFLKGAIETIKEQKPIILLSIYHNAHDFYELKPWLEDLNLGYKFDFFKGIDGMPVCETLLIAEVY